MLRSQLCTAALMLASFAYAQTPAPAPATPLPADPGEALDAVMAKYKLTSGTLQPWHLKANVKLFDNKGKLSEEGTIEEYFVSPDRYRVTYAFHSFTKTIMRNAGVQSVSGDDVAVPFAIRLALDQAFTPAPTAADRSGAVMQQTEEKFGSVKLKCIMLARQLKEEKTVQMGLFPTYCTDTAQPHLRVSYFFGGDIMAMYQKVGRFLGSEIPTFLDVRQNDKPLVELRVAELRTFADTDAALFKPAESATYVTPNATRTAGGVMAGQILKKEAPEYPASARVQRISGQVILHAIIDREGVIRDLRIMSAPAASLAVSAVRAVRQWRYKPYLLNGQPTEVDTTITVNFNIGP